MESEQGRTLAFNRMKSGVASRELGALGREIEHGVHALASPRLPPAVYGHFLLAGSFGCPNDALMSKDADRIIGLYQSRAREWDQVRGGLRARFETC